MPKKKQTAITLDQDVLEYLKNLAIQEERSRSQLINRIVRSHAEREGGLVNSPVQQRVANA
jgi:metal-responsive CopG/Arc/MetJ family transcriptional regulator